MQSWDRSGLGNAIDHARGVEEGVHLVDELLDIERNLYSFLDIAGIGAGLRRPGDAGGLIEPLASPSGRP